jgi:hypothetical protein
VSDSVTTRVEVAVSPEVAFDVFTSEIDAWYRVDTDTLPDITRTAAIRFEPQLGGRLLDVHDLATGAGRELGRITAWEPGRRLAFADNEGTEVEVSFEPRGAGTRVTLTHRGLDRLASQRAGELRRSGWAALAPFYREHIAPNARPLAVVVAFQALFLLVIVGAGLTMTLAGVPSWAAASMMPVLVLAAVFAVLGTQDRRVFVRRWLASHSQYERFWVRLLGLLYLGTLIRGLYQIMEHGEDVLGALGLPVVLLLTYWSWEEQGPARGRSLRPRAGSAENASARRHPTARWFLLMIGLVALAGGLVVVLSSVDALSAVLYPALLVSWGAVSLLQVVLKRREKHTFGFNPDLYLAVARPVSEGDERPELLVHRHSKQPEYSGWYAYASEHDERSDDLVAWTMRDLVDHSPEAARPLREGHGDWKWDRAQRAYRRLEQLSDGPRPA